MGLTVTSTIAQPNLLFNGDFELAERPNLWDPVESSPPGAQLTWATDKARSSERSLKIAKEGSDGAAMWLSENMNKYWTKESGGFRPGAALEVGGWVQTDNVNLNPAGADETISLAFSFFNSSSQAGFLRLSLNMILLY